MYSGQVIAHFLSTAVITALVSGIVLWRYRATVLAYMSGGGAVELLVPPFVSRPIAYEPASNAMAPYWERRLRRRVTAGVLLAALLSALPLANLTARTFPDYGQHSATLTLCFIMAIAIAAVPMVTSLLAYSWRWAIGFGITTMATLAVATVVTSMAQRVFAGVPPSLDQVLNAVLFLNLTALQAAVPVLLLVTTTFPRLRGVAPMVAVGLLVFSVAPLGATQVVRLMMTTADLGPLVFTLGRMFWTVLLALPAGGLAWLSLKAVARGFDSKRIADSELLANVWWVLFVSARVIELTATSGWSWTTLAVGCGVCLVFAMLYRRLLRAAMAAPRPSKRSLLVLRVFDDEARTERLFDRVATRWRWFGPVMTIAAPDLSARTVDPMDFVAFVTGRLQARFVKSGADLEDSLAHLDVEPDPDGRFRVNKLCCQADTWRAAVVGLIDRADVVVMDLRDFSTKRAGCAFELQQLGQRLPAGRLVLAVDETTDRGLLSAYLGTAAYPRIIELPGSGVTGRRLTGIFNEAVSAAYDSSPAV